MGQALEKKEKYCSAKRSPGIGICLSCSMTVLTAETQVSLVACWQASPSDRLQPEKEEKRIRRPKEDIRHTVFRPQGALLTGLGRGRANQ